MMTVEFWTGSQATRVDVYEARQEQPRSGNVYGRRR